HVRAGLGVGASAGDRVVESVDRGGVGARDEHEVGVAAGGDGGADLAHHFVGRDDGLAGHVPALLRHHLVLEVDTGDPGLFVGSYGAHDVDRIAVSGVGVGDHGDVDGGDDAGRVVDHLGAGQEADVGPADQRRGR